MTDEELLAKATEFELIPRSQERERMLLPHIRSLRIVRKSSTTDEPSWAIVDGGYCLNHSGEWEYEPFPSSRTKGFLKRCRWNDLRKTLAFAEKHMKKYPSGYKPDEEELAAQAEIDTILNRLETEIPKEAAKVDEMYVRIQKLMGTDGTQ